jgi:hypothetical protein
VRTHAGDGAILEEDITLGRFIDAGDAVNQGRFPGTIGSNQGHNLMFNDVEADILEDHQAAKSHRKVFGLEDFFSLLIVGHKAPQKGTGSFSLFHSNG